WPQLAYIGRWNLNFHGHKGLLDIYHVPGISQWRLNKTGVRIADRRIGSFYDESGKAYRVNGRISPHQIEFHIDWNNPNARWDQLGGSKFVYSHPADGTMTGFHIEANGGQYAGTATLEHAASTTASAPTSH